MKKSGKSILYLTILVLIIVVIILIGIIINLLNSNKIEGNQKIVKEQLEETTSNTYVSMETHLSEINTKQQEIDDMQNTAGQATVTADKILKNYTAYKDGKLITGTMSNNGAVTKSLAVGESYTIPVGYHNGSGKVTNTVTNKGTLTLGSTNGTEVDITDGYYTHVNTTAVYNAGKSNGVTYLGSISGGTFNATSINGYKNLSADNFILQIKSIPATLANTTCEWAGGYARGGLDKGFSLTKEYNSSTGTLTYTSTVRCYADTPNYNVQAYATITYDLYLVY